MAGLGRKVFTAGDILLASEVQGFLQDQSVMVFDDDAARTAAIATPTEGMVTFRKDDNALEVFDGSVFAPVGSEPGLVHIETQTFAGTSSVIFSNNVFSATFDNYRLLIYIDQSPGTDIFYRGRTAGSSNITSNYHDQRLTANGASITSSRQVNQTAARFMSTAGNALNAASADIFTPFIAEQTLFRSTTVLSVGDIFIEDFATMFDATTSFDSIEIFSSGNMTGKAMLYGYKQ